ncbi:hypothetical protein GJ496_008562 [Pomphorhynchus laevis]|nr:hypothetical protein GJ496_008562 [Pomphorhynchus laevis]
MFGANNLKQLKQFNINVCYILHISWLPGSLSFPLPRLRRYKENILKQDIQSRKERLEESLALPLQLEDSNAYLIDCKQEVM